MNKILLTCGVILLVVGIIYALTCTKIPKMTFWEIKGITNRWIYLEKVPSLFSLLDEEEV
jgi:xanthosine utilization system XapX-like protein